jgi:hypothetical protein
MALLNFPANPYVGQQYTLGGKTYQWTGYAWTIVSQGSGNFDGITIGTGTGAVSITTGTITIGGSTVLTTASLATFTLQTVTNNGSTTTNIVYFTNETNSTSTTTGAVQISGGVSIGKDVNVGGTVYSEHLQIADSVFDSTSTPVNTAVSTVIDSYPVTQFRTSKYLVQIDDPSTNRFQASELLMLVADAAGVYTTWVTEYASVKNNGLLGQFQSQVVPIGGIPTAQLLFQANGATNKTVKVLRIGMTP